MNWGLESLHIRSSRYRWCLGGTRSHVSVPSESPAKLSRSSMHVPGVTVIISDLQPLASHPSVHKLLER